MYTLPYHSDANMRMGREMWTRSYMRMGCIVDSGRTFSFTLAHKLGTRVPRRNQFVVRAVDYVKKMFIDRWTQFGHTCKTKLVQDLLQESYVSNEAL